MSRVLVTGATGFVGCHTVAALQAAGHQVRACARAPGSVAAAFQPLGVAPDSVEIVMADMTDAASMQGALRGCDAVVHAAAMVSFDRRRAAQAHHVNVRGAQVVLGGAEELGLDPIVHISAVPALLPSKGSILSEESMLGHPPKGYLRSKVEEERLARQLQERGAPVVIFHPGLLLGPHDPKCGSGARLVQDALANRLPVVPTARLPVGDVRDLAAAIARSIEPGRGPRRYMVGGTETSFAELIALLGQVTDRRLKVREVRPQVLRVVARTAELLQRIAPVHPPVASAELWIAAQNPCTDDSRATPMDSMTKPA
jgi:nucleoside-diphosphate-sugar epimerase